MLSDGPHRPRPSHNRCLSVALVVVCTDWVWGALHAYRVLYAELHAKWASDQWWWGQCTDMQFYEKVQEHMDICDRLQVVPESSIKWDAAAQVLRSSLSWHALLRGLGLGVLAAALLRLVLASSVAERRGRSTRPCF
jgi:hypothetical protein